MSKKEATDNIQKKCPECDSYSLIPLVYGHMSHEARIERGKKGDYAWGGCKLSQATDYCKDCEKSFCGKLLKRLDSNSDNETENLFR